MRVEQANTLLELIDSLQRDNPHVVGALLADATGLPVADSFREDMDIRAISAMSTLIIRASRTVFKNLMLEGQDAVMLEGKEYVILVRGIASDMSLIILAEANANLGLLNIQINGISRSIRDLMSPPEG